VVSSMNRTVGTSLMKGNFPTTINLIDNATRTKLQQSFRNLWKVCNIRKLRFSGK
jgi:hypothetical protein